jgi:signal transduction histidine kinase
MAERLESDAAAEVLRGLDHDLRNPVANILGFVDLVRDAPDAALTDDQRLFLERIDDNCRTLLEMLDRLTEAAKRLAMKA